MAAEKGQMIARGRTAEIFAWKDNQVLKLFLDWCPAHWAQGEALITQAVHQAGLPVPAVEGIVDVDGRRGIIFERVEGHSMLEELISKPWRIAHFARMLAELHTTLHSCELPGLPSRRERLESDIRAAAALPTHLKEAALQALAELPDGSAVCHGDFHPDNIIMSSKGPIIIDWITATQGNPLADVARTRLLLRVGAPPGVGAVLQRLANLGGSLLYSIYLKRYRQLRPVSQEEMEAWQLPVMAARLAENIAEEERRLLALIEAALQQMTS